MFAIAIAAVVVIGMSLFLFLPRQGGLVVAVAGPGKKQVDTVQVFVDGHKQCETSPCVVRDLASGKAHIVKIKAAGYVNPADQPVSIKSGEDIVVNIDLTPSSSGSGLKVSSEGSGQKLWIDGKEIGLLPQEVKDVTPGEHSIKVGGNDRYETYEEKVTVASDEQKVIGPLKLKVLRGLAIIEPGVNADGAKVILQSGSEKRALNKLPTHLDILTDREWKLVASRKGYGDYQAPLRFDAGNAERTFKIDLYKAGQGPDEGATSTSSLQEVAAPEVAAASKGSGSTPSRSVGSKKPPSFLGVTPAPAPAPAPAGAKTPAATAAAKPAAGQGTLNVNSIPMSNVIVDGRPMGSTPKMGLPVAAGSHTVVFVHPEHGRKVVTVSVAPGGTATAATRFP